MTAQTVTRYANTDSQTITATFDVTPLTSPAPTVAYYSDATLVTLVSGPTALTQLSASVWTAPVPNLPAQDLYIDYAYKTSVGGSVLHSSDDVLSLVAADVASGTAAFATAAELTARTGVTYTGTELAQVNALLGDASAHLRMLLGQSVSATTSTAVLYAAPQDEWLDLPEQPVRAVSLVKIGPAGSETTITDYEVVNGALFLGRFAQPSALTFGSVVGGSQHRRVVVTYDHGRLTIPADLKSWCMVLALQGLKQLAASGSLGPVGVESETTAIDDYSHSIKYATDAEAGMAAFYVPERALEILRSRYGSTAYVTGAR